MLNVIYEALKVPWNSEKRALFERHQISVREELDRIRIGYMKTDLDCKKEAFRLRRWGEEKYGWNAESFSEQQTHPCSLHVRAEAFKNKQTEKQNKTGNSERWSSNCGKGSAYEEPWIGASFYLVFPKPIKDI